MMSSFHGLYSLGCILGAAGFSVVLSLGLTPPAGLAIPAVTTWGYAGVLAGPAAIGLLAHATSLTLAFLAVEAILVGVAQSGARLRT